MCLGLVWHWMVYRVLELVEAFGMMVRTLKEGLIIWAWRAKSLLSSCWNLRDEDDAEWFAALADLDFLGR
jgi:hypothetical protein